MLLPDLPSRDELWEWTQQLNAFGPRLTGSTAHRHAVDFIANEAEKIGLQVQRDHRTMQRWTALRYSLSLSDGQAIPIASPFPYSGKTPADGITAPLMWFDKPPLHFHACAEKIAVVRVRRRDLSPAIVELMFSRKSALPDDTADFARHETSPLLGGLLAVTLMKAKKAGVLGVICVFDGLSKAQAAGQGLPFITPYQDCPALWVDMEVGDRLKEAIERGVSGTLVLEAAVENVATDTLFAILPGQHPSEAIIINTHTDGPNACEENGAVGLLALARYRRHQAPESRQRTLIFLWATGHFQIPQLGNGGQASNAWLKQHPELWDGQNDHLHAVAGLTIEHLGCTEWKDDLVQGCPLPTGALERDIVYTTNAAMEAVYLQACEGRSKIRSLTVSPRIATLMLGEGQPLHDVGIPTISSCPLPDYLCQELIDGGISRLDPDYLHEQVLTFHRALTLLDNMPTSEIGKLPLALSSVLKRLTQ